MLLLPIPSAVCQRGARTQSSELVFTLQSTPEGVGSPEIS